MPASLAIHRADWPWVPVAVLFAVLCAPLAHGQTQFVYVGNGSDSISAYTINASTGTLSAIPGSPFAAGPGPNNLAANPAGTFLYVANQNYDNATGSFSVYSINPITGTLTQISGSPFTDGYGEPYGIAIAPSGEFAYAPNVFNDDLSAYALNTSTGAPTLIAGSPFGTGGGEPERVAVDPTGKFVYAPNSETSSVAAYTIDQTTGELSAITGSPFGTGETPVSVVVHPSGNFVYVANANGNGITGYTINATTGVLTPIPGSPFGVVTNPQFVVTDPAGKYLYATTATSNLAVFSINSTSGVLTALSGSPFRAGTTLEGVTVSAGGKFVYATDYIAAGGVVGFAVNPTTGALTQLSGSPFADGNRPYPIAIATPPALVFSSVSHSMGTISNSESTTYGVSVTNNLGAEVPFTAVSIETSASPNPFSQKNNCGASIPVKGCEIVFTYAPTAGDSGVQSASWSLAGTISGTTFSPSNGGTLTGTVASAPAVTLTTSGHNFGSQTDGTTSGVYGVVLTNSTTAAVTLTLTAVSSPFVVYANNCPASLASGASCNLQFEFAPTAPGIMQQKFGVSVNGGAVPVTSGGSTVTGITLTGTGVS